MLRVAEPLAVLIQPDQNKDTDEQGQEHPEHKDDNRDAPVHLVPADDIFDEPGACCVDELAGWLKAEIAVPQRVRRRVIRQLWTV